MICNRLKDNQDETVFYYSFMVPRINNELKKMIDILAFKQRLKRIEYFCKCEIAYDKPDNNTFTYINKTFHIFEISYQMSKPKKHNGCLKMLNDLLSSYSSIIPVLSLSLTKKNEIKRDYHLKSGLSYQHVFQILKRSCSSDDASEQLSIEKTKPVSSNELSVHNTTIEVSIKESSSSQYEEINAECTDEWIEDINELMHKMNTPSVSKLDSFITSITDDKIGSRGEDVHDESFNSFVSCVSTLPCIGSSSGDNFNELTTESTDTSSENLEQCYQSLQTLPIKNAIYNVIDQLTLKVFKEYSQTRKKSISQTIDVHINYFAAKLIDECIICYTLEYMKETFLYRINKNRKSSSIPNLKFRSSIKSSKIVKKSDISNQTNCSNSQNISMESLSFDKSLDLIEEITESILPDLNQPNVSVTYVSLFNESVDHEENWNLIDSDYFSIKLIDEVIRPTLQLCFIVCFSKSKLLKRFQQIIFNECMNALYNDLITLEDSFNKISEFFCKQLLANSKYKIILKNGKLFVVIETKETASKKLTGKSRNSILTVETTKSFQKSSLSIAKSSRNNFKNFKAKCFKTKNYKQNRKFKIIDLLKISHDIFNEVLRAKLSIEIQDLLNQLFEMKYLKYIALRNILKYINDHSYQTIIASAFYYHIYSMSFIYPSLSIISSSNAGFTLFRIRLLSITDFQYNLLNINTWLNDHLLNWTHGRSIAQLTRQLRRILCLYFPLRFLLARNSDTSNDVTTFYSTNSSENEISIFGYNATVPPTSNGDINDLMTNIRHFYG